METVAVIDFETTWLSPAMGDRATEMAVVIVDSGKIVDRYQSLMNAGARIPCSEHWPDSLGRFFFPILPRSCLGWCFHSIFPASIAPD